MIFNLILVLLVMLYLITVKKISILVSWQLLIVALLYIGAIFIEKESLESYLNFLIVIMVSSLNIILLYKKRLNA
jgi:hypothetical protein